MSSYAESNPEMAIAGIYTEYSSEPEYSELADNKDGTHRLNTKMFQDQFRFKVCRDHPQFNKKTAALLRAAVFNFFQYEQHYILIMMNSERLFK